MEGVIPVVVPVAVPVAVPMVGPVIPVVVPVVVPDAVPVVHVAGKYIACRLSLVAYRATMPHICIFVHNMQIKS